VSALLAAAMVVATAAAASGAARAPVCAQLHVVASDADAQSLLPALRDVLSTEHPRLEAGVAPAFDPAWLFRASGPDAACVTGWVALEQTRALVRVAGAGRCRFVFRELAIERPLAEVDRERIVQVARAAMLATGEDGRAAACTQPLAPVVVLPATHADAEEPAAEPLAITRSGVRTSPWWSALEVGGSYGGPIRSSKLWSGPGVSLALVGSAFREDPELWLDLRYVLPNDFPSPGDRVQTTSLRGGGSIGWVPHVRLGLGLGADRDVLYYDSNVDWQPAARAFARFDTPYWHGVAAGVTAFLDAVHSPDPTNTLRPGLALELRWRS
jgi:hypothetical protein